MKEGLQYLIQKDYKWARAVPEKVGLMKNEFEQRIKQLVDEYWVKYHKGFRLSALGTILRKQFKELDKQTNGTKLSDYLRVAMKDSVTLIQNPKDKIAWAVIPAGIAIPGDDKAALFETPADVATPPGMIDKRLWAAFSVPLADGNRRWVRLEPTVWFSDLPDQANPEPNHFEVSRNTIIPAGAAAPVDRTAQLRRHIEQWVKEIGVNANITQEKKPAVRSLLDLFVNTLTAEQLSQTNMRLDVIKRLMETPIKQ